MHTLVRPAALASLLLAAGNAGAEGFALGAKAGTLGFGLEATTRLSESFNLRTGINSYSRSFDETASDVRYDVDMDLKSGALLFDWHPFSGTFRFSAGMLYNKNEARLTSTPTGPVTIGGQVFQPSDVGTIKGTVNFKKSAPYLGIGWGNTVSKRSPFGFTVEIGALFQGKPDVTLTSEGGAQSNNANFQSQLRTEEQEAEADLDSFKVYPVISLGFSYRF